MLHGITSQLERYMDLLSVRQQTVASNVANIDTPGYKTKDIDFRGEFLSMTAGSRPAEIEVDELQTNNDGNNVSMERESRLMAENALRFNVAANLVRAQIRMIRSAIKEGGAG